MKDTAANSAFLSPGFRDDIILRDKLFEKIDNNLDKKVIAVVAPAGYGKTTLINSYLHKRNKDFIWIGVYPAERSIYDFVTGLIYSIRKIKPGFGENIIKLTATANETWDVGKATADIAHDFAILFANEIIAHISEDLLFVIDDFHNLETFNSRPLITFIRSMISFLPPNLKLILTSRSEPDLQLSKLRSKREIFEISTHELEFTENETAGLLEKFYPAYSGGSEAKRINEMLNGWVTGIHLAMQSGFNITKDTNRFKQAINENLYNYFAEEIWSGLEQPLQYFLLRTSLLDEFTADSCRIIFNIDEPGKTIEALLNRNIFISKKPADQNDSLMFVYCYNDIFKEFLQNKLRQAEPLENINKYLGSIAEHYYSLGKFGIAIDFHLRAWNFSQVAEIICSAYTETNEVDQLDKIRKWVSRLPEDILDAYPDLFFLKAKAELILNNDANAALTIINSAVHAVKNPGRIAEFVLLKAEALLNTNRLNESIKELENLIGPDKDPHRLVSKNYLLGRAYYRLGPDEYEKAKNLFTEAIKLSDETGDDYLKADVFRFLGNLSQDSGDFEKSLFYRNDSIRCSRNVYQKMQTYNNIAGLLSLMGRYESGFEKLTEMKKLYELNPFRSLKRLLLKAEASFYYEIGDYYKSLEAYDELIDTELSMNMSNFLWHNYFMRGLQFHYNEETDSALQNFDISESYIGKSAKYEALIIDQGRALCLLFRDALINANPIESYLQSIYDFRSLHGEKILKAQVAFYLACLYLRIGQADTAQLFSKQCFELSGERQITSFLERELRVSRDVFDFAVSQNSNKAVVRQVYENVREKLSYAWLSENGRRKLTADIEKLTDIKLISFGSVGFILRGATVTEDKWIRKKSKTILAYLLSKPGSVLSKDMIIDLFFDDIPPDKADVVYHSALYNIRTALRIYDIKSDSKKRSKNKPFDYNPSYIIYEDKLLRLNPDFYYESDNSQFEEYYAKFKSPNLTKDQNIKAAENAIDLYKGEFLPGYYDNWADEMRIDYKNIFCLLCEGLIANFEPAGSYDRVIYYSNILLGQDKLNESAHVCLINAYARTNNLNAAKAKFESMLKIFDEELGEKPSAKTLQKIKPLCGNC